MPTGETHEAAPYGAEILQTPVMGVGDPADPSMVCVGALVGMGAALLLGFVANRFDPPPSRPQLPPPAAPAAPPAAPPAPELTPDGPTVPGATSRRATPMAPTRYDEVSPHDVSSRALEIEPSGYTPALEAPAEGGLFARLRAAMNRSREALQGRFDVLFGRPVDDALFEELEEVLITADVGVPTASRIVEAVRAKAQKGESEPEVLRQALRDEMHAILHSTASPLAPGRSGPWVLLVVGVNGSGKTTTIGKLAARFVRDGQKVLLAAGDTYRAAAADQLRVWADRAQADFVGKEEGADPGAVIYEALELAVRQGHDIVIIDTAGRLQTRKPLMDQLAKIRRVIAKHVPDAPHETLLVLDGTMGQNGISQARLFHEATPLSGVAITKLDGTAKGGMVLTIASEMGLPIKLIGIGEGVDDLRDFEAEAFVRALA